MAFRLASRESYNLQNFICGHFLYGQISRPGAGRRGYWIDSTIHAREWLAPATNMRILDHVSGPVYCTLYNSLGIPVSIQASTRDLCTLNMLCHNFRLFHHYIYISLELRDANFNFNSILILSLIDAEELWIRFSSNQSA